MFMASVFVFSESDDAPREPQRSRDEEILRLRALRDNSKSLRAMAEWSVEIEEVMGGRPPTRAWSIDPRV
jgi:hypothetical protein